MAIKIRKPTPGEKRLSWRRGVPVELCTEDGRLKGALDFQFEILPPEELDHSIEEMSGQKTYEFVRKILKSVSGLKDEDGADWPEEDQLEFVLLAPELTMTAFRSYFEHTTSGEHRKKD